MQEVHELRPDYPALGNLFRQVKPSHLVCSGPKLFLEDLIKLLDLPLETDLNKFKIKKNQPNITNITIYPTINKTNMRDFRKKIYNLNLPGIPSECSETDRQIFIDSAFPMYQNLMVHSLGNLLKFLEENSVKFRELFLNFEKVPIITNILVFFMESQVLIDESTFNALNIFSAVYHPSSFKDQIKKDGLSLFNLLNQCCSAIGVQCLKSMLKQPIRDIIELNLRYSTIEWCTIKNNFCHVIKIRGYLKNLLNINQLVRRILANFGNSIDWIYLKKTIYYAVLLCRLCAQLDKSSIQATFLMDLARYTREEQVIQGVLYALDKIVDLEAIYISKKFCIKKGLDDKLDEKRARLQDLKTQEYEEFEPNLLQISAEVGAFTLVYFPEIGFVLGTELNLDDLQLDDIQEDDIELVLQTIDAIYFRTPYCRVINEQYDTLRVDVIGHELLIFQGLIEYINANMAQLIEINKVNKFHISLRNPVISI